MTIYEMIGVVLFVIVGMCIGVGVIDYLLDFFLD